jgi:Tetracyclin repressor-like, C-terminal domain
VDMPYDPEEVIPRVRGGGLQSLGEQIARFMAGMLETPMTRDRIVGLVRAATADPAAAPLAGEIHDRLVRAFGPVIVDALGADEAEVRIELINSQFLGLVIERYIIGAEPLASLPPDALVAWLAPALQHYVNDPITRA